MESGELTIDGRKLALHAVPEASWLRLCLWIEDEARAAYRPLDYVQEKIAAAGVLPMVERMLLVELAGRVSIEPPVDFVRRTWLSPTGAKGLLALMCPDLSPEEIDRLVTTANSVEIAHHCLLHRTATERVLTGTREEVMAAIHAARAATDQTTEGHGDG